MASSFRSDNFCAFLRASRAASETCRFQGTKKTWRSALKGPAIREGRELLMLITVHSQVHPIPMQRVTQRERTVHQHVPARGCARVRFNIVNCAGTLPRRFRENVYNRLTRTRIIRPAASLRATRDQRHGEQRRGQSKKRNIRK